MAVRRPESSVAAPYRYGVRRPPVAGSEHHVNGHARPGAGADRLRAAADLRAAFDLASDLVELDSGEAIGPVLLRGLASMVGADAATLTHLDLDSQHEVVIRWPADPLERRVLDGYRALGRTHPLREPIRSMPVAAEGPRRRADLGRADRARLAGIGAAPRRDDRRRRSALPAPAPAWRRGPRGHPVPGCRRLQRPAAGPAGRVGAARRRGAAARPDAPHHGIPARAAAGVGAALRRSRAAAAGPDRRGRCWRRRTRPAA